MCRILSLSVTSTCSSARPEWLKTARVAVTVWSSSAASHSTAGGSAQPAPAGSSATATQGRGSASPAQEQRSPEANGGRIHRFIRPPTVAAFADDTHIRP
jgi:hypothetical protein